MKETRPVVQSNQHPTKLEIFEQKPETPTPKFQTPRPKPKLQDRYTKPTPSKPKPLTLWEPEFRGKEPYS
jgi:hypothetical protein